METTGTTMSGQYHTFMKCPFCMASTGTQIGTCPNGTMTVTELMMSATGHEKYNVFSINYNVPGSRGLNRTAYIPNSPEGKKVVKLLKIAWDRRLCFTIGTSVTTGQQNVLVWNIHHKTALHGGEMAHGYPDPTYLNRVQQELAQFGIF
jgi:deltex-like protein